MQSHLSWRDKFLGFGAHKPCPASGCISGLFTSIVVYPPHFFVGPCCMVVNVDCHFTFAGRNKAKRAFQKPEGCRPESAKITRLSGVLRRKNLHHIFSRDDTATLPVVIQKPRLLSDPIKAWAYMI